MGGRDGVALMTRCPKLLLRISATRRGGRYFLASEVHDIDAVRGEDFLFGRVGVQDDIMDTGEASGMTGKKHPFSSCLEVDF